MSPNTPAGAGFTALDDLLAVSAPTFLPDTTGPYFSGVEQQGDLNNATNRMQMMPPAAAVF